jgi:hypothetical protein
LEFYHNLNKELLLESGLDAGGAGGEDSARIIVEIDGYGR